VGVYDFVFVRTACDGLRERTALTVTIAPK
jgi:hypothetical protein